MKPTWSSWSGMNPGTNMPRMLSALEETKRNGGQVIAVNPLPEAGLIRFKNPQKASGHHRPRHHDRRPVPAHQARRRPGALPGAQRAAAGGRGRRTRAPCSTTTSSTRDTTGFDEFAEHTRQIDLDRCRLPRPGFRARRSSGVVDRVLASKKIIVCWAMGVTQQKHGVPTIREIVNFLMLRGNLGRPGAGVCPVRGHSNVQGDRTMGIWERMPQIVPGRAGARVRLHPADAPRTGLGRLDSGHARRPGQGLHRRSQATSCAPPPTASSPSRPCGNCRLTAHISTKLNLSHTVCGETALILPTLGRSDRDVQAHRRAVRHGRGLDEHRPPIARPPAPRRPSTC